MKKFLFSLLFMFIGFAMQAQQDAQYTNYMYNTLSVNPAYAGSNGAFTAFASHRNQWRGITDAPVTNTFSIHAPVQNTRVGLGLSVMNDNIGPSDESTISGDFSYTIDVSSRYKLAFGLRATAHLLNVDFTKLNIYNPGDALAQYNIDNKFSPNLGLGLYLYSNRSYFGVSVPNLLETNHFDKGQSTFNENSIATERLHLHLITGVVFDLNEELKFKPAALAKVVSGAPLQVDVSANFMFKEKFVLGASYRVDAAVSVLAGFQASERWFLGYSYDREVTTLASFNSGSHELFLRFQLFKNFNKTVSPRFF